MTDLPVPAEFPVGESAWDVLLARAVCVLTEAARLRRPADDSSAVNRGGAGGSTVGEPVDWAEFVTLALTGAAANVGCVEKVLRGRPGSWEADGVRGLLRGVVGEEPGELLRHRSEPLRIVLYPAEMLLALGYGVVYEESRRVLAENADKHVWRYRVGESGEWAALDEGAPACTFPVEAWHEAGAVLEVPRTEADEAEYHRLLDLDVRIDDVEDLEDPRAYGEALRAAAPGVAAELYPGVAVEVEVRLDVRAGFEDADESWGPEEALFEVLQRRTPLPWSGLTPGQYPCDRAGIVALEREAGRLPHQRIP